MDIKILAKILANRLKHLIPHIVHPDKTAFDRVDWSFLKAVLKTVGLGPYMLTWIMAFYSTPSAQVKVNGLLSPRFLIMNGTRQGCPLSPLLFALTLEPLLRKIQANPDIKGLTVGNMEHKLSAYADDVLFHLPEPLISLPNLIKELRQFGALSNFEMNYSKSEILPIVLSPSLTAYGRRFPLHGLSPL